MGLDRQQRVAVLSTGEQLRYSLLLLTAGLQDQTLARIAAGDEAEDAPVASAQDLAKLTPEVIAIVLSTSSCTRESRGVLSWSQCGPDTGAYCCKPGTHQSPMCKKFDEPAHEVCKPMALNCMRR